MQEKNHFFEAAERTPFLRREPKGYITLYFVSYGLPKLDSMFFRTMLLLLISLNGYSQSFNPERVAKIKNATVRISIEGTSITGSGFFINDSGLMLTCWHVISTAIEFDTIRHIPVMRDITCILNDGRKIEYGIPSSFILDSNLNTSLVGYDFAVLKPKSIISTSFLKLGSFLNSKEGDEVYTSGYPLSINNQFVSKGMISTKYFDTANIVIRPSGNVIKMPRQQALLDMTLNSGNSGGAIIKVGRNIEDDEVIGIADFIINPIAPIYNYLMNSLLEISKRGSVLIQGINPVQMYELFAEMFKSSSVGISGCVSIDHVKTVMRWKQP